MGRETGRTNRKKFIHPPISKCQGASTQIELLMQTSTFRRRRRSSLSHCIPPPPPPPPFLETSGRVEYLSKSIKYSKTLSDERRHQPRVECCLSKRSVTPKYSCQGGVVVCPALSVNQRPFANDKKLML